MLVTHDSFIRSTTCTVHNHAWGGDDRKTVRVAAAAALRNPCAGSIDRDLEPLIQLSETVSALLSEMALQQLGGRAEVYGKGAVVGIGGEAEHAAAILHPHFGRPLRAAIGGGKAIIPSTVRLGVPGTAIDVPLHHKDDAFLVNYVDSVPVMMPDAPLIQEIVVILVVGRGSRVSARVPPPS